MTRLYPLTDAEHATVLAALRMYQAELDYQAVKGVKVLPGHLGEISTKSGTLVPLTGAETEQLAESLNHNGLAFGEIVNLIGVDDSNPYVAAAHEHRLLNEGTLEVDGKTVVSESENGAYVMAWLWVDNDDAARLEAEE